MIKEEKEQSSSVEEWEAKRKLKREGIGEDKCERTEDHKKYVKNKKQKNNATLKIFFTLFHIIQFIFSSHTLLFINL